METKKLLFDNLHNFFGFDQFKGQQEAIITNILSGNDTFVIMPTGAGKSMCYQLPAMMSDGVALVISPLIALMKNQVDQIRAFGSNDSIAHFLNSSLTKADIIKVKSDVMSGDTKLLYIAPESLAKQENLDFLKSAQVSFVAIDEAHCISEWGHDFRPEYRKIRTVINQLGGHVPIIALTATATPKVQQDIMKNLQMQDATLYKSSFNRPNLYYDIRPKKQVVKEIIKYIKANHGKSGIIYCLSRKKVEEIAENLNLNGIKALPYHAGLEAKERAMHQDMFLMEDVDVIVATIAFGMGIDKPDVRFVIHHDMPKSLEGYYQETGRVGRDGGEGNCIAFYAESDIMKLAKFMKDKPVAEKEIGLQILNEVVDYAESSACRRKQILYYFGETFNEEACNGMCDNCRYPRERFEAQEFLLIALKAVKELNEKFNAEYTISVILGEDNKSIQDFGHIKAECYGAGKEESRKLWESVIRQALLSGFLQKDIENYGLLKITKNGLTYINNPTSIKFSMNKDYESDETADDDAHSGVAASDTVLFNMLKDLCKQIGKKNNVPPFVVFQEPSLQEMSTHYPLDIEELKQISGVGTGKAAKFGAPFVALIKKYVEENDIDRPMDMVVKTTANKSAIKVAIIQNIDRKISLEDIANSKGMSFEQLIGEIESIVSSGTKLNLSYYIDELIDDDRQDEVFDYFRGADSDSLDDAITELGNDDYTKEEIQLMRIKFMSELGN
ncbi:MAG: DNA helicase RecQ [Sphingobacteriales bacterium]|nr:DNA helicase RecQ [Sphingobacteriales bacterium]